MTMILIKNGRVVDPVTQMDDTMDVLVRDDKIVRISKEIESANDIDTVSISSLWMRMFIFEIRDLLIRRILKLVQQLQSGADLLQLYAWQIQNRQLIMLKH